MFLLSVTTVHKLLIPKEQDPRIGKIQSQNPRIGKVTGIVTPTYHQPNWYLTATSLQWLFVPHHAG